MYHDQVGGQTVIEGYEGVFADFQDSIMAIFLIGWVAFIEFPYGLLLPNAQVKFYYGNNRHRLPQLKETAMRLSVPTPKRMMRMERHTLFKSTANSITQMDGNDKKGKVAHMAANRELSEIQRSVYEANLYKYDISTTLGNNTLSPGNNFVEQIQRLSSLRN